MASWLSLDISLPLIVINLLAVYLLSITAYCLTVACIPSFALNDILTTPDIAIT